MKAETAYNVYLGLLEIMPEEEVKRFKQKIGVLESPKKIKIKEDELIKRALIEEDIKARYSKLKR